MVCHTQHTTDAAALRNELRAERLPGASHSKRRTPQKSLGLLRLREVAVGKKSGKRGRTDDLPALVRTKS